MPEKINLNKLQKNLDFFKKMYDCVRLVDPVNKKVIEYRNGSTSETSEICYGYWGNGFICENCISVRAYREKKSFMKLEHSPTAIMLVTALPIETSESAVVLELLKNATESMMIGQGEYSEGQVLYKAVQDINAMVVKDELTSLYNRRFLDERLPIDIIDAVVNKKQLSVIFIDIDNMKAVNDEFGHSAGDGLLKYAANIIQSCIRESIDWVARYGGDEFFACLKEADEEEALRISKRIQDEFSRSSFSVHGNEIKIKVSQGCATMPETGVTAEELIELADSKMYSIKRRHKIENKIM